MNSNRSSIIRLVRSRLDELLPNCHASLESNPKTHLYFDIRPMGFEEREAIKIITEQLKQDFDSEGLEYHKLCNGLSSISITVPDEGQLSQDVSELRNLIDIIKSRHQLSHADVVSRLQEEV